MVLKNFKKSTTNFFVWALIKSCHMFIKGLSRDAAYRFAGRLGLFLYLLSGKHRGVAFEGLRQAFGSQKKPDEISLLAKESFVHMAKSAVEMVCAINRPSFIRENFRIVNKDVLDKALSKGKGVILVSAHFGNFPGMIVRLSLEGYKTSAIMRPLKNKRIEAIFESDRSRLDIDTILSIPRKSCVEGAIRSLRNNRVLFIPLDQNFGTAGVFVDFFGRKAATATGPIVLAQRTKALVVPCFTVRQKDDTNSIVFEPAFELIDYSNAHDTILKNTQRITNIIEGYIRRYPQEWSWIHRRWKARPKQIKTGQIF